MRALIIMAKAPDGKKVKTRLAGLLPDRERLALYESLVENTVEKLRGIDGVDTLLNFWPADAAGYFSRFGLSLLPQRGSGLGARMHNALGDALALGYGRAVLVGADIPGLSARIVLDAFEKLSRADAVFGPSEDGGYYLVGLKSPEKRIFEGVAWASADTLSRTLDKARALGMSVAFTETLYDIDTPEDFLRYRNEAAGRASRRAATD